MFFLCSEFGGTWLERLDICCPICAFILIHMKGGQSVGVEQNHVAGLCKSSCIALVTQLVTSLSFEDCAWVCCTLPLWCLSSRDV